MAELDRVTKYLRGPLATTGSGLVTWARIFTHEGRLYVAETPRRGATVRSVHEYMPPEGDWSEDHGRRRGTWGEWSWEFCGCGNQWGRHSIESLLALVEPLGSVTPDDPDPSGSPTVDED